MHFPLGRMRRTHFGSFVLLFSIDEQRKMGIRTTNTPTINWMINYGALPEGSGSDTV
jgi:hypothetical protein